MTEHETGETPVGQLQELLLASEDITGFLDEFSATMAQALSTDANEVWCAVTLLRPKRSTTVAASTPGPRPWMKSSTTTATGPA